MSASSRPNLLPVAAFVSLLVLALGATGLFSLHYTNARATAAISRLEALDQAMLGAVRTRAAFKTQVQEWKNILLRGRDPADLATYRTRFENEEATVRTELQALGRDFPAPEFADAPVPDTLALLGEHARLGEAYRAALATFTPGDPEAAHRTDTAVRGIDRKLSDQLDSLAAAFEKATAAELRVIAAESNARYAGMRLIVQIVAGLAVLAAFWLVFLANRAART